MTVAARGERGLVRSDRSNKERCDFIIILGFFFHPKVSEDPSDPGRGGLCSFAARRGKCGESVSFSVDVLGKVGEEIFRLDV